MRQETGSNQPVTNNKVSIQLRLDGHSFSAEALRGALAQQEERATICVEGYKTTLVPRETFEPHHAERYLRLCGKYPTTDERVVFGGEEIVAVMAIPTEAQEICESAGIAIDYTSPLLDTEHSDEECTCIYSTGSVCFMRHHANGLQRAEAVCSTNEGDTLYYIIELRQEVATSATTPLYIKSGNKQLVHTLKRYFKNVICE